MLQEAELYSRWKLFVSLIGLGGPRASCPVELQCSEWVLRYFGDCVCNGREAASFGLGLASVFFWAVAEVPQIVTNFFVGSTEGISLAFLLTWTVGDVFNLTGCFLEPATLPTQLYMAVMYTATTLVLVGQSAYYEWLVPRLRGGPKVQVLEDEQWSVAPVGPGVVDTPTSSLGALHAPLLQPASGAAMLPFAPQPVAAGATAQHAAVSAVISVPLSRKSSTQSIHISSARSLVSSHTPTMGSYLPRGSFVALHGSHSQHPHAGSWLSQSPGIGAPHVFLHRGSASPAAAAAGAQPPTGEEEAAGTGGGGGSVPRPRSPRIASTLTSSLGLVLLCLLAIMAFSSSSSTPTEGPLLADAAASAAAGGGGVEGDDASQSVGEVLGWLMAAIYMGGRIPQIWLNIQRGTVEGLSPLMFLFALLGNATYVGSILVRSLQWEDLKPNLPWIVDAAACVLLDIFILAQFAYYSCRAGKQEGSENEEEYWIGYEADGAL